MELFVKVEDLDSGKELWLCKEDGDAYLVDEFADWNYDVVYATAFKTAPEVKRAMKYAKELMLGSGYNDVKASCWKFSNGDLVEVKSIK